jgi:exosortase
LSLPLARYQVFLPFALVSLAWLLLFGPVCFYLADAAWTREENAHAPLLMAFCFGAIGIRLKALAAEGMLSRLTPGKLEILVGGALTLLSALLVFIGRVEQVDLFMSAAQLLFATGAVLLLGGVGLFKQLWVPLVMLGYLIVWPGWLIDTLTAPLKMWISSSIVSLLSAMGLPVASAGVTLAIGQYQLLIADACAGLNSLIALTSVGAMYLYLVRRPETWRNAALLLAAIPIAIIANYIRVLVLVLITYYGGYDMGQSFLHEFAGLLMFGVALCVFFLLDAMLDMRKATSRVAPLKEVSA